MQFCYNCLGRAGGRYTALEPFPGFLHTRPKTVKADWVLGPTLLGKTLAWPEPFGRKGDHEYKTFGVEWFSIAQELLDDGKLKSHPLKGIGTSIGEILYGLEVLKKKQVSGQKLICQIS